MTDYSGNSAGHGLAKWTRKPQRVESECLQAPCGFLMQLSARVPASPVGLSKPLYHSLKGRREEGGGRGELSFCLKPSKIPF